MANTNLFTVKLLVGLFTASFLNAQIGKSIQDFQKTDFYQFFNFKAVKESANQNIYKPGAFQEFLELKVDKNLNAIQEMSFSIHQDFIQKNRFLAADIFKSFLFLHISPDDQEFKDLFEVLSSEDGNAYKFRYYLDHILWTFLGDKSFFVIPVKEKNVYILIENKDKKLITTAKKFTNPKPLNEPIYDFLDNLTVKTLNPNLMLQKYSQGNQRTWIDNQFAFPIQTFTQIQYHFIDENSAKNYLLENFEEFTEKGKLEDISPVNTKVKKIIGNYFVQSEIIDNVFGMGGGYILAFQKEKVVHKLFIFGDENKKVNSDEDYKLLEMETLFELVPKIKP